MSRDHRQQAKDDRERRGGRPAEERDADKPGHASAKTLKTYGIRQDEARRQIRELRSRY